MQTHIVLIYWIDNKEHTIIWPLRMQFDESMSRAFVNTELERLLKDETVSSVWMELRSGKALDTRIKFKVMGLVIPEEQLAAG